MKIFLNFIMKNEERVLTRMLNSVLPIIDGCICVDTGSTDNSKKIVQDFFKEHDKYCEIHDHAFVNFSDARNFALSKLKGISGYGFWIDCDEELIIDKDFDFLKFKKHLSTTDCGLTTVIYNSNHYMRMSFFKIEKDWYWRGAVHELLMCKDGYSSENMYGLYTKVYPDGNSWNEENKYLKHAIILEKEVKKTNDPRDVFYLAQSYKDAGKKDKAIEWYQKRANRNDGSNEEKYYSQHMVSHLTDRYREYFKAQELDSERGEHLLNLILKLQRDGFYQMSYILSKYAVEKFHKQNPYPNRRLFIDNDTYEFKLVNSHIFNCEKTNKTIDTMDIQQTYEHLCQSPSDINEHLPKLKEYAEKCETIIEMGVRWCVSTYSFLAAKPKQLLSFDINHHPSIDNAISLAKKENIDFSFIKADVLDIEIKECDFLFIDTKHTYNQLKQELKLHGNKAKKYLGFHDVETFGHKDEVKESEGKEGLLPAILEFMHDNPQWQQDYLTEKNNGLLILKRNEN